jgi:hypothetical protein
MEMHNYQVINGEVGNGIVPYRLPEGLYAIKNPVSSTGTGLFFDHLLQNCFTNKK